MRRVVSILVWLSAIAMVACINRDRVLFRDTNSQSWCRGEGVVFVIPNEDTTNLCDINLVFRTDRTFCADSIPFLIKVVSPRGDSIVESLQLYFAEVPEMGITGYTERLVPYRTKALLGQSGNYRFVVDCQSDEVVGISGVGVQICTQR